MTKSKSFFQPRMIRLFECIRGDMPVCTNTSLIEKRKKKREREGEEKEEEKEGKENDEK